MQNLKDLKKIKKPIQGEKGKKITIKKRDIDFVQSEHATREPSKHKLLKESYVG